jgi:hypothetical protein
MFLILADFSLNPEGGAVGGDLLYRITVNVFGCVY